MDLEKFIEGGVQFVMPRLQRPIGQLQPLVVGGQPFVKID
jgi:hypothetical protein